MRIEVYKCDECLKILSDDKVSTPHLSVEGGRIGYASRRSSGAWSSQTLLQRHKQFCNQDCLKKYLNKRLLDEDKIIERVRARGKHQRR